MKTKISQSNFKQRITEKYYIFSRKMEKKWENFLRKGHEKMTIMFIPHNEKGIFNFQISKFTLMFFLTLFIIVIISSTFAVINDNAVKEEEKDLMADYKEIRAQLLHFQKLTYSVKEIMDDIKPQINDVYRFASGSEDIENIWIKLDRKSSLADEDSEKATKHIPSEIYELQELRLDIKNATNTLSTVNLFLSEREKIKILTPSKYPLTGHVTSLFGWRRSPFGFGRDFHTGIDIAASGGTPIYATAKGVVASAGWSGGYGNMIKVRHEYGFETIYAHCSRLAASTGKPIRKGEVVGYVGNTGSSTGFHCHYEIRLGGNPINPYPYMSSMW